MSIREGGDEGKPALNGTDEISKQAIQKVAQQIARQIAMRNANVGHTKLVEVFV